VGDDRLRAIEDAVDEAIIAETSDGTVTSWNRAACELFGYTSEQIVGRSVFALVLPEHVAAERERRQRVLAGARERLATRMLRRDGGVVEVELTITPVTDDAGATRRCLSIIRDVGAQKLAEHRLGRAVLAERMASIGTLAAGVGHEINNPLAFISTNLDMLEHELRTLHGGNGWDEIIAMVKDARQGAERIRKIVRGMMTLARPDEDRRVPISLERVLELATQMVGSDIRHRARLVRVYTSLPIVLANEARLGQVFCNLLLNAVEAIPPGQADRHEIRITADADSRGNAIIEISDTGKGIAPEIRPRIFDPFFTTKAIGEGLGLGLSICHAIVHSLGGELTFRSETGTGSTFRVVLPASSQPLPVRATQPPAVTTKKRGRVLVVDDEVVFASSLRRLLAREHQVTVVHSGREAIERITGGLEVDVIVCDLMMPDLTGVDVHQHLSEHFPDLARRMIFLTGGAVSSSAQQFLDRIGNRWFEKPCDIQDLRSAIQKWVA
jgi:PAS domain S-box-containing protein